MSLTAVLQLAFTYAPPLQAVFDTRPVSAPDGAVILLIGAGLLAVLEAEKWLRRMSA